MQTCVTLFSFKIYRVSFNRLPRSLPPITVFFKNFNQITFYHFKISCLVATLQFLNITAWFHLLLGQQTIFTFVVAASYNDSGFNLYNLSLSMKLNIPKCQCSFTLLTTVCSVGGVTSRFLSLVFLYI